MRLFLILTFLPHVLCFNAFGLHSSFYILITGHQIIASIAQRLLTSQTADLLSKIVHPNPLDLATIAPWADRVKHTHAYYWSGTLHYINPIQDFPPETCSADFSDVRTPDRTLLKAIANYTERLSDDSLDRWGREEALRFLVHFIGDAEQPLHCLFQFDDSNYSDWSS
jgi:S1/P1 Nuclease